jgi:hypothetical protein
MGRSSSSVVLDKSWNKDAGDIRRDRGAEQKAYQVDTPLWNNKSTAKNS